MPRVYTELHSTEFPRSSANFNALTAAFPGNWVNHPKSGNTHVVMSKGDGSGDGVASWRGIADAYSLSLSMWSGDPGAADVWVGGVLWRAGERASASNVFGYALRLDREELTGYAVVFNDNSTDRMLVRKYVEGVRVENVVAYTGNRPTGHRFDLCPRITTLYPGDVTAEGATVTVETVQIEVLERPHDVSLGGPDYALEPVLRYVYLDDSPTRIMGNSPSTRSVALYDRNNWNTTGLLYTVHDSFWVGTWLEDDSEPVVADRLSWTDPADGVLADVVVGREVTVSVAATDASGAVQTDFPDTAVALYYHTAPVGVAVGTALATGTLVGGVASFTAALTHLGGPFQLDARVPLNARLTAAPATDPFNVTLPPPPEPGEGDPTVISEVDIMEKWITEEAETPFIEFRAVNTTTGAGVTLSLATPGFKVYRRQGDAARVDVTSSVAIRAPNQGYVAWGLVSYGNGVHRLYLPKAWAAAGAAYALDVEATGVFLPSFDVYALPSDADAQDAIGAAVRNAIPEVVEGALPTTTRNRLAAAATTEDLESLSVVAEVNEEALAGAVVGHASFAALAAGVATAARAAAPFGAVVSVTPQGANTVVRIQRKGLDGANLSGVDGLVDVTVDADGRQVSALPVGAP